MREGVLLRVDPGAFRAIEVDAVVGLAPQIPGSERAFVFVDALAVKSISLPSTILRMGGRAGLGVGLAILDGELLGALLLEEASDQRGRHALLVEHRELVEPAAVVGVEVVRAGSFERAPGNAGVLHEGAEAPEWRVWQTIARLAESPPNLRRAAQS